MSAKKHKKTKASSSTSAPESSVEAFREIANQMGQDTPAFEQIFAEPWPDWMSKLAVWQTRIAAPQIIAAAKRGDDEFMHGQVAAAESQMVALLEKLNVIDEVKKLNDPRWNFMVQQLEIIAGPETTRIKETMKAAAELPLDHAASFSKAFGDGVQSNVFEESMDRVQGSTTAQICFFIMTQRVAIEKRAFKNVTQLAELFLKLRKLAGDMPAEKVAIEESIKAQFRKICSVVGLKLSGRGRPPGK